MPAVTFANRGKSIAVPVGTSVLDAAMKAEVTSVECCGIEPACGRCRMAVLEGMAHLSAPDALEAATLAGMHLLPFERLACMALVHSDVLVELEA